ncbi:MAG: ABC transporter substrate-binding protein [Oscillospiraceae bacterium]
MFKKFYQIAAILFFVLIASGCTGEEKSTSLKICIDGSTEFKCVKWIEEFANNNPSVTIEIIKVPSFYSYKTPGPSPKLIQEREEFLKKLHTEIMAGKGPDVYFFPQILVNDRGYNVLQDIYKIAQAGVFADGTEFYEKLNKDSQYIDSVMEAGKISGHQYIFPTGYNVYGILANKNIITEEKIDISNLNSLENYVDLFDFAFGNISYFMLDLCSPKTIDVENKSIDIENQAFITLLELWEDYTVNPPSSKYAEPLFPSNMRKAGSKFDNFRVINLNGAIENAPARAFDGEQHEILLPIRIDEEITGEINGYVAVGDNCKNKDAAFKFVEYVLSENAQVGCVEIGENEVVEPTSGNGFPVRKGCIPKKFENVMNLKKITSYYEGTMPTVETIAEYEKIEQSISQVSLQLPYYYYETFEDEMQQYIDGKVDLNTALEKVKKSWEYYIDE